ncbi:VIT domain-containing protein [Roseateles sp. BYS87W]|uniref:VIT domain-containing protein n=1 Tax=Pelomonas baiyunensis TaxID=3299026 RepID=A0ABW7H2H6_9BURK
MSHDTAAFLLTPVDDEAPRPVLCGVQAHGVLDGVLLELTVRQTYRNASRQNLEVVYTFPLPSQAVLLGFASELNGQRMQGQVVRRQQAEQRYEEALREGNAPVMLQALGDGLHTANIGNLKPQDELVIELRYAQLLCFEQGRLRLSIPTTIAPRHGNPTAAGLQPQQVPTASLHAAYPLEVSVVVGAGLGDAAVECATHRVAVEPCAEGRRYRLAPGAWLDRDVVFSVQPAGPVPSLLVTSQDRAAPNAGFVALAAFQPPLETPRAALALKLLVDCSGSMAGDSLASAKSVLHGVLHQLGDADSLSLTRFGSTVEHLLPPSRAVAEVKHHVQPALARMEADLGGTEMALALRAVFALEAPSQLATQDVLLLTDGEIWEIDAVIASAQASQHRLFIIGLGSCPAEGPLRRLAEATGGAAEFVTPGEALEAAARRMLTRMRQPRHAEATVDWGATPVWQTRLPRSVYGGDTVIAFAGFAAPCALTPCLMATGDSDGRRATLARTSTHAESGGATLPRMAAAHRMAQIDAPDAPEALALALSHQLLSDQTHCILVHVRAAEDQATDEAELHQVSSMLAAGWGATSTVRAAPTLQTVAAMPSPSRQARPGAAPPEIKFSLAFFDDGEDANAPAPAFLRAQPSAAPFATLREVAEAIHAFLRAPQPHGASLDATCRALSLHDDLLAAIAEVGALVSEPSMAWLLLGHWINTRPSGLHDPALRNALTAPLSPVDQSLVHTAMGLLDQALGLYGLDDGCNPRQRRPAGALRPAAV